MDKPIVAGRKPAKVELEAGQTYSWCRCGKSKAQPFCDGQAIPTAYSLPGMDRAGREMRAVGAGFSVGHAILAF